MLKLSPLYISFYLYIHTLYDEHTTKRPALSQLGQLC